MPSASLPRDTALITNSILLRLIATIGGTVLRGGRRARLSILLYHRVLRENDPLLEGDPDAAHFRQQMTLLSQYFNVLPLGTAIEGLKAGRLPPRSVCVTFDDGYRDNADIALPVLREFQIPATFFVASGYLNGGRMFNDSIIEAVRQMKNGEMDLTAEGLGKHMINGIASRKQLIDRIIGSTKYRPPMERNQIAERIAEIVGADLPTDLMMSSEQVRELSEAGMEIGGHTVTHPILREIPDAEAAREVAQGREELVSITGQRINSFAYPNGKPDTDYAPQHVRMAAAAGFSAAVSTAWGVSTRQTDRYQLARFTPWDRTPSRFALRLVQNGLRPFEPAAATQ
jgi:peptidoglycan/xylan/chitin deacetylase (PgdA/CDA1 family)